MVNYAHRNETAPQQGLRIETLFTTAKIRPRESRLSGTDGRKTFPPALRRDAQPLKPMHSVRTR